MSIKPHVNKTSDQQLLVIWKPTSAYYKQTDKQKKNKQTKENKRNEKQTKEKKKNQITNGFFLQAVALLLLPLAAARPDTGFTAFHPQVLQIFASKLST